MAVLSRTRLGVPVYDEHDARWARRDHRRKPEGVQGKVSSDFPAGRGGRGLAGCEPVLGGQSAHHLPVFGIDSHGSCLGFASPLCSSSMEMLSGERMNAMRPSRGGRLMVMPAFMRLSQVA
jgi:hypothetical protein